MTQQLLFPELDPYLTKVKDIDYIDITKVKCGELKKTSYSIVPEGMFVLFKSGGFNKYHPEMGNAFPYIQNTKNELGSTKIFLFSRKKGVQGRPFSSKSNTVQKPALIFSNSAIIFSRSC